MKLDYLGFNASKECRKEAIGYIRFKASSVCPSSTCGNPCEEVIYTARDKRIWADRRNADWILHFYNENPLTVIKSVPDFPPEQFLGTFGGVIGLGGKLQVIFQFLLLFCLLITNIFARNM